MAPWAAVPFALASRDLAAAAAPGALHPEETVARLMLAMAVVIVAARLAGIAVARLGQPRVMGEVTAGILLGPTLLGRAAPGVEMYLFPPEIIPLLAAAANIGLAFYMFLVGLELDPRLLKGRVRQAAIVSNVSVLVPMIVGGLLAAGLYSTFAPPGVPFIPFALFIGVSMSVTAFPVLARILVERGMLQRPIGALALAAAAVDDVSAWLLLALATAAATAAAGMNACAEGAVCTPTDPILGVVRVLGLVVLFVVFMGLVVRRLLVRVSGAFDSAGRLPLAWVGAIFVGVLLATSAAGLIGVAPIFGAFVFGLVMPRGEAIARDVARRLEDFVAIVLLPLFFVVAGLRANIGLIQGGLILLTIGIIAVAIVGKLFAAAGAARLTGMSWRESAAVGTLMNTRGLTELIVLTVGLSYGVIGEDLFTMLVIMALVTTFMTAPLLRIIDPTGALTTSPTEAVEVVGLEPVAAPATASLLVACIDDQNLDSLLAIAVPLATAEPPREVVALRVVEPSPFAAGLSALEERVHQAEVMLDRRRRALAGSIGLRTAVLTSVRPERDLVRLANRPGVDLVLVDGRPPLLGDGPIGGPVRVLLEDVVCDVAVLVRRPDQHPDLVLQGSIVVPFGGADQDWAAVELGAWLATTSGVPLRLVGVAQGEERDPSRLLVNASIVVQQLTGVVPETRLVVAGEMSLSDAMTDGSLLLVGLSDRWREEGLGPVRTELARTSHLPVLFVRRGTKPGALAPRDDLTRFSWSFVGREAQPPVAGGVGTP
jgi:K+:H+ antiporter